MISELLLLILLNFYRTKPLLLDDNLSYLAQQRAERVYNTKWSHNNWEESFNNTNCWYMGENLAKDFDTSWSINTAFLNSPTHKENMIKKEYNKIGIGQYKNIVVELFCGEVYK